MLVKDFIEKREDGHTWYDLHSDAIGKAVRIIETNEIYSGIAMRDDDPHTFEEVDDPNYVPEDDASKTNEELLDEITRLREELANLKEE